MSRNWKSYTARFLENDSDDDLLKTFCDDEIIIDIDTICAFYPSKYEGFVKIDTDNGFCCCIKTSVSQLSDVLGIKNWEVL